MADWDNHWRVFNKTWFCTHQKILLWLLNSWLLKRWFRYVLKIHKSDCSIHEQIVKLAPSYYIVALANGRLRGDFRTHARFAKRIYYSFKPLWWLLHWWDTFFADRLMPRLAFGFSTLTVYPDPHPEVTSVDGYARRHGVDEIWADLISGAGTGASDTITANSIYLYSSSTTNQWQDLARCVLLFDTSGLSGGAIISAAVISLRGYEKQDQLSATPDMNVYTSNPASNTAVVGADYGAFGAVAQCDTPLTYANWNTSGYNDFDLNSTGIGNINATGISKFGLRNANYDVAAVAPPWLSVQLSVMRGYSADRTGTANDPKLVITYSGPFIPKVCII